MTQQDLDDYIADQLAAPTNGFGPLANSYIQQFPLDPLGSNISTWSKAHIQNQQIILALTADNQLREVMAQFWDNHFSTQLAKVDTAVAQVGRPEAFEKREVNGFRSRALGNFASLLKFSMNSQAMRIYLDGAFNCFNPGRAKNENYAREVLELHTMGVDLNGVPNYSNDVDIPVVTEILSGMEVNGNGDSRYLPPCHLYGNKLAFVNATTPFVWTSPNFGNNPGIGAAGNAAHLTEIRDEFNAFRAYLVDHPATKSFICTKLVSFFVGDNLPAGSTLIADCIGEWGPDGDIKAILEEIFGSPEFLQPSPPDWNRLALPMQRLCSQVRLYGGSLGNPLAGYFRFSSRLTRMRSALGKVGALPLDFPSPDGFPLANQRQVGTSVAWTYGEFSHYMFTDITATPQERGKNVIFDLVSAVETEVARRNFDINNPDKVAEAVLDLHFHSRWTLLDQRAASILLTSDSTTGSPSAWPVTGTERELRIGLMVTFITTLAQASEK